MAELRVEGCSCSFDASTADQITECDTHRALRAELIDVMNTAADRMEKATATIDRLTAEVSKLRAALSNLIYVKNWKDTHGKDEAYQVLQPAAWDAAKSALQRATDSGTESPK